MKLLVLVVLLAASLVQAAAASDLAPDDFAYGLPLSTVQAAPIYELVLPQMVYETITRPDYGDIRVFNGQGEVVPHTVLRPGLEPVPEVPPISLPFFPLSGEGSSPAKPLSLKIRTDKDGVIIDVNAGREKQESFQPEAYILDGSAMDGLPDRLELDWRCDCESLVTTVRLEVSSDLNHWSGLVSRATLADLRYGVHQLKQRSIRLPRFKGRYFRLTWPAGKNGAELTRVRAIFPPGGIKPQRWWKALAAVRSKEKPDQYLFETGGYFPVDRLRVQPPQQNTLVNVTLLSGHQESEEWRPIYNGLIYHLSLEGNILKNDVISISCLKDPDYLLKVDPSGGGLGAGLPTLEIGWLPRKLYFVARGDGPYLLAFGSAVVPAQSARMDPLLNGLNPEQSRRFIKSARIGDRVELGGLARLEAPQAPRPWRLYLLWAVLAAGVLILGIMARKLYRQINAPDQDQ